MSASSSESKTSSVTEEYDQTLHTALKKLKMDSECACAVTKEEESQKPLKHKHDSSVSSVVSEDQLEDRDGWNKTLQNLCLCDSRDRDASDKTISKSTCSCQRHWHKARSTGVKNSLNLVHAAGVRKPILREARLRFPVNEKSKQLLRAARLRITNKAGVSSKISAALTSTTSATYSNTAAGLSATSTTSSASIHIQGQQPATSVPPEAAFATASSGNLLSFSSLGSTTRKHHKTLHYQPQPVPQFEGYRDGLITSSAFTQRSDLLESAPSPAGGREVNSAASAVPDCQTPPPSAMPSTARLDLTMERSCSQEARLDEMSVIELAAYFEDFIHIPKKMSSMAEMMYT